MSYLYDEYLHDHLEGVQKAYGWLVEHHLVPADSFVQDLAEHDASKREPKEYEAYDRYFYGGNKSYKVVQDFKYAWLHHIHHNPHHWQYWVLQHDDEPEEALEMPKNRVIEMICDWWSFSWKSGNLGEIFEWHEKHKDMKLHENTRKMVEDILGKMRDILEEENHLEHHGIKGQKWGVQNGPPYPIKGFSNSAELSEHMQTFKYKEFDKLMSPDEVGRTKSGSCHDQVMYEFQQLRRMGKNPKGLFVMEYSDDNQGGMTHSLVHYNENGKEHWFDNAWQERAGDTPYDNLEAIKREIERAHASGEFGDKKRFKNIIFGEFNEHEHQIGETLQELVDKCLKDSD